MSKIHLNQNINYSSAKQKEQKSNTFKTQKFLLIILKQFILLQKIEKYF